MSVATFTAIINQLLPEPHAGLLNGIIFGTKTALSKELYDALVRTGTLHIVALSGMNITILVKVMHGIFLRFVSRRVTNLLTVLCIAGFVWFVGPSPSVIRAAIMGSLVLLSVVLGRQNWSILTLALACGGMLLLQPAWIGDLSFQLSAFATLGIILFGGKKIPTGPAARFLPSDVLANPSFRFSTSSDHINTSWQLLTSRWQWLRALDGNPSSRVTRGLTFFYSVIADNLRITLAAQVFTIPLILFVFGRMSIVSPLTNLLIGWTIPILTPLGMFVAIAGWIWLPLGYIFALPAWALLQYLIIATEVTAGIPFASIGK